MRKNEWLMSAAVAAGLCLAGLAGYAQQQGSSQQTGDPVADAARKAREDKKNAPKPKRVFTDDDVKPATPDKPAVQNATAAGAVSGTGGATGASQATGAQKAGDATKPEGKEDPNSEKAWRKRFSDQHEKIARTEKEIEVLQRELDKSQTQYSPDPQKALNEQYSRADINEKTAKIAAKKKELEQLQQQLDDMEADLRKAGGDPAWAR